MKICREKYLQDCRTNSKSCDLVALLVQREDRLLIDVVGGSYNEFLEPVKTVLRRHLKCNE